MRKDLIIINNEKCLETSESYYCENIEISSINDLLSKKFNVKLILRKSNINPIHRIKNNNVFACSNIFSFIKNVINIALKKNSICLIIAVTPYTFASFLFLILFKREIFLYLRSDGKKEISAIFGKKISIIYKIIENIMVKFCNLIVVNNIIVKKKKFKIVNPSQIDEEWFKNIKKSNRNQIKLLYVGRLKIEKGIYSLIDIFNKIKFQDKKILLTLIGQGKKPTEINERIKFINPISKKEDLIKQYDAHDIFILPSFTEGQPQVLIESLIRQRPVIVFKEIQHVCQNYKGVFIVERNAKDLFDIINFIDKNYEQILSEMKTNKYPTKENFLNQLDAIFKMGV